MYADITVNAKGCIRLLELLCSELLLFSSGKRLLELLLREFLLSLVQELLWVEL